MPSDPIPSQPSLTRAVQRVRKRDVSAVDRLRAYLARIEQVNPSINAFREVYAERSLARAADIDQRIALGGDPGPLAGAFIAVKDNIATDFGRTSCGSRMLEEYRSPFTATAVKRLEDAGAIILGKTNCDEFAMGSSTEHCAFGIVRNPLDASRVPGGSSGGSAAAVAAGLCDGALGSETGGSIRQPAAFCGVSGLKPSYGRVSRYGLVAFASSLDQIGPIGATVADTALLLKVIAGHDPNDMTSAPVPVDDDLDRVDHDVTPLRIGVARMETQRNDPQVDQALEQATARFRQLGAQVVDIELPLTKYGIATYYVIAPAEASSNLARFDGIRYGRRAEVQPGDTLADVYARSRAQGFGPEVQRRIMLGTYVLSAGYYDAYFKRASQVRRLIKREFDEAFARCDVLLGPTTPTPAFRIGEKQDPLTMYQCDVYTVNANIAGLCAMSVPCGMAKVDGTPLPIGLQLQAPAFQERLLLRVARMFERSFAADQVAASGRA